MHNQIQRYWNKITFIHILKISNIIFKRERKIKLIELIFKKLTLKVPKPHLYYLLQLHKTELVIIKKNIIIRPEKGALCYLLQHHNPMHNNKWKWGLIQLSNKDLQANLHQKWLKINIIWNSSKKLPLLSDQNMHGQVLNIPN